MWLCRAVWHNFVRGFEFVQTIPFAFVGVEPNCLSVGTDIGKEPRSLIETWNSDNGKCIIDWNENYYIEEYI